MEERWDREGVDETKDINDQKRFKGWRATLCKVSPFPGGASQCESSRMLGKPLSTVS
ncbi:unnamed protein product [Dovyalis caffra]|uniref:Uncharacterized protein n=1 Tax=Dovyalis caffra TaxID=77055 RepID=A0AAV1S1P1_9ROSI|nr:unnamed protein product [Dovyalis caffra]